MVKKWKTIKLNKDLSPKSIIERYESRNIVVSHFVKNIYINSKNKLNYPDMEDIDLFKVKLSYLGFNKQTELQSFYSKILSEGYNLVNPLVALISREHYLEQKNREWLRFATPHDGLIDTDGTPHLIKLGKALNIFFIETYWSYPKAIFHPHNEFIISK